MNKAVTIADGDIAGKATPETIAPVFAPLPPNRLLDRCHNIEDLRKAAKKRLPRCVIEFFDRGSEDEVALRGNREAFQKVAPQTEAGLYLVPKVIE